MDVDGKVLKEYDWENLSSGAHHYTTSEVFGNHKVLIFQLHSGDKVSIQKVVVR
jgi:hypothetical protein